MSDEPKEIAHCGSPTTHFKGGEPARIITCCGLSQTPCGPMARLGDLVEGHMFGDEYHPPNPIVEASGKTWCGDMSQPNDLRPVARVGDKCQCGAVIMPEDRDCKDYFRVFTV